MRRILLAGLLLTGACVNGTAPSAISGLQVNDNVNANGVFVGDSVQFSAVPLDFGGNPLPLSVQYSSSNTAVGTVTINGLVTILSVGTTTITISSGNQSAHVPITVDPNIVASVVVTPNPVSVAPGALGSLTATVITTLNHPARNKTLVWSTTDATKVTVDQTGKITGVANTSGVSVCAAASDAPTVKGCATVNVLP
jgi:uncharacterized protein YjdB